MATNAFSKSNSQPVVSEKLSKILEEMSKVEMAQKQPVFYYHQISNCQAWIPTYPYDDSTEEDYHVDKRSTLMSSVHFICQNCGQEFNDCASLTQHQVNQHHCDEETEDN